MLRQQLSGHPTCEAGLNGSAALAPAVIAEPCGAEQLAATLDHPTVVLRQVERSLRQPVAGGDANPPAREQRVAQRCAAAACAIALLALAGWLLGVRLLAGQWRGGIPMPPGTALALLFLSGGVFSHARWSTHPLSRRVALAAAGLAAVLGLLVLAQFITGRDWGAELALARTNELFGRIPLGRMSPFTAAAVLLESGALLFLLHTQWRFAASVAALLGLVATVGNLAILLGYSYGTPLSYGGANIPVALSTALALVLVGVGQIELALPGVPELRAWRGDSTRGVLVHAFLPVLLAFMIVQSWVEAVVDLEAAMKPIWDALTVFVMCLLIAAVIGFVSRRVGNTLDRVQGALRESEARFRELFDGAPVAYHELDMDGVVRRVNRAECTLLGYEVSEMVGRPIWDFIAGAEIEASREVLRRKLSGEQPLQPHQRCYLQRGGGELWIEVHDSLVRNVAGETVGIRTALVDITERKRAEEDLQFRNVILSTQQEVSIDGIVTVDERARIISCNRRFVEMWGLPPKLVEDGMDEPMLQFAAAQVMDPRQFSDKISYLYEHRRETSRDTLMLVDGRVYDLYSAPMFGPEERYYGRVWYFRDITEAKQAEEALRQSERRFKLIAETIDEVFWMNDAELRNVLYVSSAYERIWGRPRSEAYKNPRSFLDAIHPDDSEKTLAALAGLQTGLPFELEFRIVQPDGTVVWIWDRAFPVRDAAGKKLECYVGIAQDITERKRLEQAILANSEKLARSNEELERFAYVASHDLQEPLRMVASFTQLLSKKYSGKLDETADRYINFAVDGAKRMQQLITDLLAYSRVNSKDLVSRPVECEAVVRGTLQNLRAAIDESGAVVECDPLPDLIADQVQLGQLFQNLIGNAIKFRGQAPPRVHIAAEDHGADWQFSVRDNGIGIDPKHADRVFQIFQRLHTREQYPGTGIGLAVCKKVVERHGGRLWVESQPGTGSNFLFTLPKASTGQGSGDTGS